MAYVLLTALRRIGLAHTGFAVATCDTIRLRLLKIGAIVTKSVRRIRIALQGLLARPLPEIGSKASWPSVSSACPNATEFRHAHTRLSH